MTIEEAIRILDPETGFMEVSKYSTFNDSVNACREAGKIAADELRKRQWISVKDRLPVADGDYLVYFDDGFVAITFYKANKSGKNGWEVWADDEVTHWMELPEPPKEVLMNE